MTVSEYVRTLRRVSRVLDNMLLHFRMKHEVIHKDEEEAFATRPVKAPKVFSTRPNGSSRKAPSVRSGAGSAKGTSVVSSSR